MNEDEARRVRDDIQQTPNFMFHGYGFNNAHEIFVRVQRQGGGSVLELSTAEAWERFKGYARLLAEEEERPKTEGSP